jgi:hypothetical protein
MIYCEIFSMTDQQKKFFMEIFQIYLIVDKNR